MSLTCIILAGGPGKRLMKDKASLEIGGKRVIDIQLRELGSIFDEFLIIGNSRNTPALGVFERDGVRVVEETFKDMGPLGGLLSGLELSSSDANLALACDMPFVKRDFVSYLLERVRCDRCDAVIPRTPGGLEPLLAAYSKRCIPQMKKALAGGRLKLTGFLDAVKACFVSPEEIAKFDPAFRMFTNINTDEDLRKSFSV